MKFTGLDRSEGETIRNYIIRELPNNQKTKLYEKYRNRIENHTDYDAMSFFCDYRSIKQQSVPDVNSVYLKEIVENNADTKNI